jgi:1-deoxy-D-xylulose-5-phosphate synthase
MKNQEPSLLSRIHSPQDVRTLNADQLPRLAEEIRERIIKVVLKNGGHLASNLGVVELTIALHRAFNSPKDRIYWDVGHQCYTHKILTGRNDRFPTIRQMDGLSGFPKCSESKHDFLETGHASTSVSAGIGTLVGNRMQKRDGKVVVVIGDGALTGGMAYEGLNFAGHLDQDLVVIYNDNNMSISPNVGGISAKSNLSKLSSYVTRLTTSHFYQRIRETLDRKIRGIPVLGYKLFELMVRMKRAVKAAFLKETLFSELGFEYVGPIDGHSISELDEVLENVKHLKKPVVVHVVTRKGKGYAQAEQDPSQYHGVSPVKTVDGKVDKRSSVAFTEAFANSLINLAEQDEKVVAVSAAMCKGTGLDLFQNLHPDRLFDVGIAEQHAVTYSAGLAISGLKPVVAVYSTFMQRAVDQVIHDVALQQLPVIFAMDRAGLVGGDGETHQGVFDIPLFKSVPGISFLAPADEQEMDAMLQWAHQQGGPVMLRYPKAQCPDIYGEAQPLQRGRGALLTEGDGDILLVGLGGLLSEVVEAGHILADRGIKADVYNMRFIKPLDESYLLELFSGYHSVYMVEDGAERGGIGEYIASLLQRSSLDIQFRWRGVPDTFFPQATRDELIRKQELDRGAIAEQAAAMMQGTFRIVQQSRQAESS